MAHAAAAVATARAALAYGALGETEGLLATAFVADVVADLIGRVAGREADWGVEAGWSAPAADFLAARRDPAALAALADVEGPRHLGSDFELVRETFHRFAEEKVRPHAEHVHRTNGDIPEEIISGLAELGGFGLSVPEEYDGFATGGESDYMGMVVATEELSWGSLGIGGSLITRPEILTRALVYGGTEEQKKQWLPKLASAEVLAAVAVTEPDFGSDVAGIVTSATPTEGGWLDQRRQDLVHLRRPGRRADAAGPHRPRPLAGPSRPLHVRGREAPGRRPRLLVHPGRRRRPAGRRTRAGSKGDRSTRSATGACTPTSCPSRTGSCPTPTWSAAPTAWGRASTSRCRASRTGGCRRRPGRSGVMQAAYEAAASYAANRKVFGSPIGDYQLTQAKLGRMAVIIQATRQSSYHVARLMAQGEGALEASMVKAYVCRAAEWVTREAMQIHGGMGYAEEFPVSRYFVDARVLSIFEGADETLALKVIARRLIG